MATRLYDLYREVIKPELFVKFGYTTPMQVPYIEKITLNMGVGKAVDDKKILNSAVDEMAKISGQKPVITLAHKSISAFKIRAHQPIGCKVTLRKHRMYEFLDRLITIAIPRIRDFRGCSAHAFDKQNNYSLGIKEQIVFPEIDYDKIDAIRGLDIVITMKNVKSKLEAIALLLAFNFPLKDQQ